jgi:hypothetical protein
LLRSSSDIEGVFDEGSENSLAWNTGGGVLLFFGNNYGVRFDIRYFKTFDDVDTREGVVNAPARSTSRVARSASCSGSKTAHRISGRVDSASCRSPDVSFSRQQVCRPLHF